MVQYEPYENKGFFKKLFGGKDNDEKKEDKQQPPPAGLEQYKTSHH